MIHSLKIQTINKMIDLFDEEKISPSENYSPDSNQLSKICPFKNQPDNISITEEHYRHLYQDQSQIYNVSINNNISNEGQSPISSKDNNYNNQDNDDGTLEKDDNFRLKSNESNEYYQSVPQEHTDNNQSIGDITVEVNKEGVIQKEEKTKSEKNQSKI